MYVCVYEKGRKNMTMKFRRICRTLRVIDHKQLRRVKAALSKKNKAREITLPDFKVYYKTVIIKTV